MSTLALSKGRSLSSRRRRRLACIVRARTPQRAAHRTCRRPTAFLVDNDILDLDPPAHFAAKSW